MSNNKQSTQDGKDDSVAFQIVMWMSAHDFKWDNETDKWIYDGHYLSTEEVCRLFKEDQAKSN